MSKFIATNRSNDCPVCGDISGKCKSKTDGAQTFYLCVTEATTKKLDVVNGYKCIGNKNSRWATFVLDEGQPRESFEERQQRRKQREAEEKAVYQAGLPASEREVTHSQILEQLSLHPIDAADLARRGLSAETIAAFRSVERWQSLEKPVSDRTPACDGRKLLTPYAGYLVPCLDLSSNVTGFQIRNRYKQRKEDPKYPWLSTTSRPANLQNGELPLTFAPGAGDELYLCEGILKPMVAAERLGVRFIGAAGGMFASSPEQFKQWVNELKPSALILCADGGALVNPDVMREYWKLWTLATESGYSLKVQWWGQETKGDLDIDEILQETFTASKPISWVEFLAKAPDEIREKLEQQFGVRSQSSQPVQKKKKSGSKAEWKKQLKIERDRRSYAKISEMLSIKTEIDTDSDDYQSRAREKFYQPLKQYLKYETHSEITSGFASEMQPAVEGRSLLAYDCSQGTGKSNNALIPAALRVAKGGGRVLIIVPTRGLAREFKGRINERAGEDVAATHLDSNYYGAAIVVTCPESVYKFKGQRFELIQIDEANEGLHRVESAELGNAGPQSLAAFGKLLPTARTVAIATAAMSGWTLAAVQTIGGFTPVDTQLQRRSRPTTEMRVIEYRNFYQWLQKIIDALHSGQRVAIPTGSQGKGRIIDRTLRKLFPSKVGLVVDGKATMQNQRSRFLSDPDAFLATEQPDWFIFTPVINSGVSIEGQHFDIQFEYATPHEGAQSISQRGERVRSAIGRDGAITERHILFSTQGAPTLEAYPEALDWQYWVEALANEANAPVGAAAALAKALGASKALKPMVQEIEKFAAMRPNLSHFLALKAFEIIFKEELLHEDWERYGWQIDQASKPNAIEAEQISQLKDYVQEIRLGLIQQQGRTLKKTRTRESEVEIEEINNPFQAARAAKAQLEKLLGKNYLAQQNEEFFTAWFADKSASNPGVRSVVRSQLLSLAVTDPDCWQQIERMKALKFIAAKPDLDTDEFWNLPELPAAARDIELTSIMSRCPGIAEVVTGQLEQWTNQDPQVLAAGLYLIAHAKQIAANTKRSGLVNGAKFSEQMAPTALFNKALELMGYTPKKMKREGSGARLNVYRLETESDVLAAIAKLKEAETCPLKLFRAELRVIRAQSRHSINAAAKSQIMTKALAWVSDEIGIQVGSAIAAIKRRHANLIDSGLSELGDGFNLNADELREGTKQMALVGSVDISPPLPRLNS